VIRLSEDPAFRSFYFGASYTLLDSRFLSHLLRFTKGVRMPVCTGSDLTAALFSKVISHDDPIVIIGGSESQASCLREKYGLRGLAHFNPAMGFIHDPVAMEECLQFVEAHSPFRFCLLAVGAPQQELVAHRLQSRGKVSGLALCIGASINFLTGVEQRAPSWMQRSGVEWTFRLFKAPRRMARRYLIRGPRVFGILRDSQLSLRESDRKATRPSPEALILPVNRRDSELVTERPGPPQLQAVRLDLRVPMKSQVAARATSP
jgi:exopolysaccharide biosynthesis WecB/TagA/CpsF family protein